MRRRLRIGLLALAALPFVLFLALRIGLLTPAINLTADHLLAGRSPLQVRVGRLRSDIGSFLEADDVVLMAPVRGALVPLVSIASLRLEYDGWDAWRGRLDWDEALRLARVRGMNIFLLRDGQGDWNLSALSHPKSAPAAPSSGSLPLPATRLELEDCQVVLSDESRDFRASVEHLQGTLDARALPLVAFTLYGSTDGHKRANLSLAGEWDRRDNSLYSRLDLANVGLARYINYFLPPNALQFTGGDATFSVRLRRRGGGPTEASGRADVAGGSLHITGIGQPLDDLKGTVVFDQGSLHFRQTQARFLGAEWSASGTLKSLAHPEFDLSVSAPDVPLEAVSSQVKGLERLGLSGSAAVDATLTGPVHALLVKASLRSAALSVAGVPLEDVRVGARLQGSHLELQGLQAAVWGGRLSGDADMGLARQGRLKAQLQVGGADLDLARVHGVRPLPLSGLARVRLKASGLLRDPELELGLDLDRTQMGGLDLGPFTGQAQWGAAGLDARFQALQGRLEGRVAFSRGSQPEFHNSLIVLKGMPISATAAGMADAPPSLVLPAGAQRAGQALRERLGGTVDARISLEGGLASPQLWVDMMTHDGRFFPPTQGPLALRDPVAGLNLRLAGALGIHAGSLQWGRPGAPLRAILGRRKASGGLELQALGRYPFRGAGPSGHLALAVDGDLRLLDSLTLFTKTQGRLSGDVILSGTPDSPVAEGDLSVKGFQSDPIAYVAPLRNGDLRLAMHGSEVQLAYLSVTAGGLVTAQGRASLARGLGGLSGSLTLRTDATGLRFDHWDSFGSGSLRLDPVTLSVDGPDSPLQIGGRVILADALIVYGGSDATPYGPVAPVAVNAPTKRPLGFDLSIGVGANVWYEKHQPPLVDFTDASSLLDPSAWLQQTFGNMLEALKRPDLYFRLAPTDKDILLKGESPDIQLQGRLAIDRGRITILENEFQIKPDNQPALIHFNGRHGEVQAVAVAHLRYTVTDPTTQRPVQKSADVTVKISPMSQDDLERSDLAQSFLSFQEPEFSSDPVLVRNDEAQNRQAIFRLIVLGDPMVDANGAASGGDHLGTDQLDRLVSAELRKEISALSQHGFKLLGSRFIDVFRVVPRLKVQTASGTGPPATASSSASASANASQNQGGTLSLADVTVEIGKSLGDKFYASLQGIGIPQSDQPTASAYGFSANYLTSEYGLRAGLEYQINPNRTWELYYNYAVNDDLDPVPYLPGGQPVSDFTLRLRNTIPTDNYSAAVAEQRRWDWEQGGLR